VILALRQLLSRPILDKLHDYLLEIQAEVLPKSPEGRAVRYALKNWTALAVQVLQADSPNPAHLEVTYAGSTPNMVAGVIQINFRLPKILTPPNLGNAEYPLLLSVAGVTSSTVLVAVAK
jgi:uncharacterized protein (TIGR03437 family)